MDRSFKRRDGFVRFSHGSSYQPQHAEERAGRTFAAPWRVMTFMWQAVCAALFPVELANIKQGLERFLAYLSRWSNRKRERRAIVFLRNLEAYAA